MSETHDKLSIAVTGVGAIIGQGIIRSLRASSHRVSVVGVDRNSRTLGSHLCDFFAAKTTLNEDDSSYLKFWCDLVRRYQVKLVLPGLDVDMEFLDAHREIFKTLGCELALNTHQLISQTRDKWTFGQLLASIGLPSIPSVRTNSWHEAVKALGPPPLLLKPLRGNGSRGIVRLNDSLDFDYWTRRAVDPWMLQRIVGSDDQEYTVGVFGLGGGRYIGPVIMRRRLSSAGNTLEAEVVLQHETLEGSIAKICERLEPLGPTNLQFRVEDETPYLLEINPRFSSSNSLRTAFGFNEASMSIDHYLGRRSPAAPQIRAGHAWRYAEDFVVHAGNTV